MNDQPEGHINLFGVCGHVRLKRSFVFAGAPMTPLSRRVLVVGVAAPGLDGETFLTVRYQHPDGERRLVHRRPLSFDGGPEAQFVSLELPGDLPEGELFYEILLDGHPAGGVPVTVLYDAPAPDTESGDSS